MSGAHAPPSERLEAGVSTCALSELGLPTPVSTELGGLLCPVALSLSSVPAFGSGA